MRDCLKEVLSIIVFDFLIGNTDRHQSNWALVVEDQVKKLSPLYNNSSSLCAYVAESRIREYLGKDKMLWNSLVDTKSRSRIRIKSDDVKLPTHTDVLKYLKEEYYKQTIKIVNRMKESITAEKISSILKKYDEDLSENRTALIKKYILCKLEMMQRIYLGQE